MNNTLRGQVNEEPA